MFGFEASVGVRFCLFLVKPAFKFIEPNYRRVEFLLHAGLQCYINQ